LCYRAFDKIGVVDCKLDADSSPDLRTFGRLGARKRLSGRKALDQNAKSGDVAIEGHPIWVMPDE